MPRHFISHYALTLMIIATVSTPAATAIIIDISIIIIIIAVMPIITSLSSPTLPALSGSQTASYDICRQPAGIRLLSSFTLRQPRNTASLSISSIQRNICWRRQPRYHHHHFDATHGHAASTATPSLAAKATANRLHRRRNSSYRLRHYRRQLNVAVTPLPGHITLSSSSSFLIIIIIIIIITTPSRFIIIDEQQEARVRETEAMRHADAEMRYYRE